MKHLLYKTVNKLNGRFYVGMHSTRNINDAYLGSGRRLKAEVNKYGRENFEKIILEELPSREILAQREREVVNDSLRENPLCLNLKNGGEGGGRFWGNKNSILALNDPLTKKKAALKGNATLRERRKNTQYTEQYSNNLSISKKFKPNNWLGRHHSEETKCKLKLSMLGLQKGEKNSQFGTCWVTNGVKPIKIKKEQLDEYLANGFIRGRKYE